MSDRVWMKWTDEEIDALRKLSEAGYTLTQVHHSGIFARSRESIANSARSNNISLCGPIGKIDMEKFKEFMEKKNGTFGNQGNKVRKP